MGQVPGFQSLSLAEAGTELLRHAGGGTVSRALAAKGVNQAVTPPVPGAQPHGGRTAVAGGAPRAMAGDGWLMQQCHSQGLALPQAATGSALFRVLN